MYAEIQYVQLYNVRIKRRVQTVFVNIMFYDPLKLFTLSNYRINLFSLT